MNAIKLFSLAPPAPSGGAWGEASPQTPAKHSSRVSGGLDMGDVLRFPLPSMRRVRPRLLHAPRLAVRPGAPATALTSTLSIIHRTLFLAGVWGEASPLRGRFFGLAGALTRGDGDQDRPCGPARTGRCARRLKKPTLKREASPQAPLEARWTAGRSRRSSQPWAGGARSDIQASPKARWTVGPRVGSREPGSHGRGSRAS